MRLTTAWTSRSRPSIRAFTAPASLGRTADLVIRPTLRRSLFGLSPLPQREYLDAGIDAARQALPAIRALLAGETPAEVAHEFMPRPVLVPETGGLAGAASG